MLLNIGKQAPLPIQKTCTARQRGNIWLTCVLCRVDFFAKSPKYPAIGKVKREPGWEKVGPVPTLCEKAESQRPTARARPAGK